MPSLSERIDDLNARLTGLEVAVQDTYPAKFQVLTARITRLEQRIQKMDPLNLVKLERWLEDLEKTALRVERAAKEVEKLARARQA